jgi:hypothetical protein
MITSNLPFSKWEQIFKDPKVTAAAIDRLVHHSVILELNIESYRMQVAKKNKSKKPDGAAKRLYMSGFWVMLTYGPHRDR